VTGINSFLLLGFVLGLRHALDPDHVVAVSNLASSGTSAPKAARIGLLWGTGHALVLFVLGFLWIVLNIHIPEYLSQWFESLVGLILIVLGLSTLWRFLKKKVHIHMHEHDGKKHIHFHTHSDGDDHCHSHKGTFLLEKGWVPFVIGMFHGAAGSAAILFLTFSVVPGHLVFWYLAVFSIGPIISMGVLAFVLAFFIQIANKQFPGIYRSVWAVSGLISLAFGIVWLTI
jgi:ABC-type nickel/cobalt efflux system permease component RcnA